MQFLFSVKRNIKGECAYSLEPSGGVQVNSIGKAVSMMAKETHFLVPFKTVIV